MNTFHVAPDTILASTAVNEVRAILTAKPEAYVAVRGRVDMFGYEEFYGVCEAPADCRELGGTREYMWEYVPAKQWVAEYDAFEVQPTRRVVIYDGKTAVVEYPRDKEQREYGVAGVQADGTIDPKELLTWLRRGNFLPKDFPAGSRVVMRASTGVCYLHGESWDTTLRNTGVVLLVLRKD